MDRVHQQNQLVDQCGGVGELIYVRFASLQNVLDSRLNNNLFLAAAI